MEEALKIDLVKIENFVVEFLTVRQLNFSTAQKLLVKNIVLVAQNQRNEWCDVLASGVEGKFHFQIGLIHASYDRRFCFKTLGQT